MISNVINGMPSDARVEAYWELISAVDELANHGDWSHLYAIYSEQEGCEDEYHEYDKLAERKKYLGRFCERLRDEELDYSLSRADVLGLLCDMREIAITDDLWKMRALSARKYEFIK